MKTNERRSMKLLAGATLLGALATTFWVVHPSGPGAAGRGGVNSVPVAQPVLSAADQTCALLAQHYPQPAAAGKPAALTNESALRFTHNPYGPGFVPDQRALAQIENDARASLAKPGWHPVDPAKYVRPVLPDTFAEAVHVRTGGNAQWEARARPLGANSHCAAEVASDGTLVYKDAFAGCDVAYRASALKTEEFIVIREEQRTTETQRHRETTEDTDGTSAPPESGILHPVSCSPSLSLCASVVRTFSWELDVPAGLTPRLTPAHTIEFVDSQAVPRLRINAPEGKDANGKLLRGGERLTLALDGSRVTLAANLQGLKLPVVIDPSWSSTGSMAIPRPNGVAAAVRLTAGKVLVIGGGNSAVGECELYDPSSGTWAATGQLNGGYRENARATLLADGKVLVTGGDGNTGSIPSESIRLWTCEIFDPSSEVWTSAAQMSVPRANHSATLLPDGTVLVAGGYHTSAHSSCEVYNPTANTWTGTGALSSGRYSHTATLLGNGTVLVIGGYSGVSVLGSCEIYSPSSGTWQITGAMAAPRVDHTTTLTNNGQVLVTGGNNEVEDGIAPCELFDPAVGGWQAASSMATGRFDHAAVALAGGKILVAGGFLSETSAFGSTECELFDPLTITWQATSSMQAVRREMYAVLLDSKMVLVVDGAPFGTGSCEIFDPSPIARPQNLAVHAGGSLSIPLAVESLYPWTLTITSAPAAATLTGSGPRVTYKPNAGFAGSDSFRFKVNDRYFDSNVATVSITVTNTAPLANGQTVSTHWGTAKAITLTGTDADGDALTFAVVAGPQHGTLSGTPPNVTYTPAGTYVGPDSFTFKANDGAADSNVATVSINVTDTAPTVTASAAPTSVVPNGNVIFTSNGTDADGDALSYSWVFGDGGTANEQNPTHAYSGVGVYTAVVTVTDSAGATGSNSVTIQVSQAPTARLTTDDVVAFAGNPFQFDASYSTDPENAIASYTWDFGDGTPPGAGQVISKIYDQAGEYTVTLTVTDAAGVSDTLQRILEVLPASDLGLFNGFVNYKTNWDRYKSKRDSISVDARVNVGAALVGPNTTLAFEIAGQRFTGKLDKKLRDYTKLDARWQVKANIRRQPFGTVTLKLTIMNADLGLGFNQAGALVGPDPHDWVKLDIPAKVEIGGRTFELSVPSQFKFNRDGTKASGTGKS